MVSSGTYVRRRAGAVGLAVVLVGSLVGGVRLGLDSRSSHRFTAAQETYASASVESAQLGAHLRTLIDEGSALLAAHDDAVLREPALAYLVVCVGRAEVLDSTPVRKTPAGTLDELLAAQTKLDAEIGRRAAAADDLDAAIEHARRSVADP